MSEGAIWSSKGCLLWMENPFAYYEIYDDHIKITTGIFVKRIQTFPLHKIAAKELYISPFGRLFKYGRINLLTRGIEIPDGTIFVKNPDKVLSTIERITFESKENYRRNMK